MRTRGCLKGALLSALIIVAFMVPVTSLLSGETSAQLTSGLVGYWKFDEGLGNIVYDSSGYSNHGTIYGATWTDNGKFGGALYFGGDDYVLVPSSPSLEITDELTLEAWIKVHYSVDSTILTKRYRFSEVGYGLHFWDSERVVSFNVGASMYEGLKTREISLELDNWYHIAGTYIESTGEWKIYVNGALENSLTRPGELAANNAPIYIGSHNSTSFFRGVIDEIRIYNRALSPDEILQHYFPHVPTRWPLIAGIVGAVVIIGIIAALYMRRRKPRKVWFGL